jgi:hypothetical protein
MHTATVQFELSEASEHLQKLVADLHAGRMGASDDTGLGVQLAHILDHISRAWNCKDMTGEQASKLSQEEFERLSNTVPNFHGDKVLGEFALA